MNCVRTRGEEPPRLYGVINGLLRMRNGLRRSQELDDLVDVLASSIGALTNPRTNCPHRRRSRRRSLAARDRRQLPEDRPRTRRGQTRPRRARHPHDERLRFPPRPGQPDDVTPWIGYNVLDSVFRQVGVSCWGWCRFVGLVVDSITTNHATRPSSRRRSMMLMPNSVLIRLSRYQTM